MKIYNTSINYVSHQFGRLQGAATDCFTSSNRNSESELSPRPHTLAGAETSSQISNLRTRFVARLPFIRDRSTRPETPEILPEQEGVDYYNFSEEQEMVKRIAKWPLQTHQELQKFDEELARNVFLRKDAGLRLGKLADNLVNCFDENDSLQAQALGILKRQIHHSSMFDRTFYITEALARGFCKSDKTGHARIKSLENQTQAFKLIEEHFRAYAQHPDFSDFLSTRVLHPLCVRLSEPYIHPELCQPLYDFLDQCKPLLESDHLFLFSNNLMDGYRRMHASK